MEKPRPGEFTNEFYQTFKEEATRSSSHDSVTQRGRGHFPTYSVRSILP
jgi:hypothetical protein